MMEKYARNRLEIRMGQIRRSLGALSKYGMSASYYKRELTILENIARKAREEIETAEMQTRLSL